jgi:hypothetical protein
VTAQQLAALMKRRQVKLLPALQNTTSGLMAAAIRYSKEKMSEEIYALPEDLTTQGEKRFQRFLSTRGRGQAFAPKKGDRKWVRTGHLRRSEHVNRDGPVQFSLANSAAYAEFRHEAGKPGRRPINPLRVSHWQDDTFTVMHPIAVEQWRETILDVLRAP